MEIVKTINENIIKYRIIKLYMLKYYAKYIIYYGKLYIFFIYLL